MKHLIAIFSVILTLGTIVPSDGFGGACPTDATEDHNANEDIMIGSINGSGAKFFHCDKSDCGEGTRIAVIGAYFYDGHQEESGSYTVSNVYVCETGGGRKWAGNTSNTSWCADTGTVRPDNTWDMETVELLSKDRPNGRVKYTGVSSNGGFGVIVPFNGCYGWYCKSGLHKNSSSGKCEDTSAQETCTNSHGQWDATNSTCLCGPAPIRTDGKGDGQTYDAPGASCKCSDSSFNWDDSQGKCIAPDAAEVEACSDSGGNWEGGECKCNETTQTQSSDKKTCIRNDAYFDCTSDTSGGDWVSGSCKCDSGKGLTGPDDGKCRCSDNTKVYDPVAHMCVLSAETWCRQTGGEWNAASETCNCNIPKKNIKEESDSTPTRCECINEDYKFDNPPSNGCVLTDEAKLRIDTFEKLRDACLYDWNMTFTPGAYDRDVDPKDWVCNCDADEGLVRTENSPSCKCDDSRGYVLDSVRTPYKCRLSDYATDKQNCADATDATWIEDGVIGGRQVGHCECNNRNQMYNYATKKCLDNDTVATWCAMIPGAAVSRDGSCLCRSTKRPPVGYRCPDAGGTTLSTATGSSGPSVGALSAATQKKEQVSSISKKLKEISDSFGRSHWKTASGNFNGARLASDSIAGVVLGTVGGVVTSNIIKKNQVKGGFENLNCTVGGQMVADYGDQFQVGVR